MSTFVTKLFGTIDVPADGHYAKTETVIGGTRLERSLFIAAPLASPEKERATSMLDTLDDLDARAREAIGAELASGATVKDFVDFHLEEVPGVVTRMFGAPVPDLDAKTFLAKLGLVGIGVHPNADGGFHVVLDYSPARDLTDQLLAVRFDAKGVIRGVSHES